MAGRFNLKLRAHFFNKIDQEPTSCSAKNAAPEQAFASPVVVCWY
jgi:hypothetical protein